MFTRAAFALSCGLAVAGVARPSAACGPGGAKGAQAAPRPGTSVPSNIPAAHLHPGWQGSGTCASGTLSLVPAGGPALLLTESPTEQYAYPLPSPLLPGQSYTLDYTGPCVFQPPPGTPFVASAPRPLPVATGKLEVVAQGVGSVGYYEGSCYWGSPKAAWVRLRLRPACDLVPFLPVTRFVARAQNAAWWSSGVGSTIAKDNESITTRTVDLVFAHCSSGPTGIPPGPTAIEMHAQVVGAAQQPVPAVLTVDLSCAGPVTGSPDPQPAYGMIDPSLPCWDGSEPPVDAGTVAPDGAAGASSDAGATSDAGASAPDGAGGTSGSAAADANADADQCAGVGTPGGAPSVTLGASGGCAITAPGERRGEGSGLLALFALVVARLRARPNAARRAVA